MESSDLCYLDKKLYPHLLLVPAVIIVTVLAFLNKRRSFKEDVWGGRPGLVIPLDFLGLDHDRFAISATFGASAGFILKVILYDLFQSSDPGWAKAFESVGYALKVAVLCYPLFACLTTERKVIGAIMGLLYSVIFSSLDMLDSFDKCHVSVGYVLITFVNIPLIVCYLFVIGKYVVVLYVKASRPLCSLVEENRQETESGVFTKPWLIKYVKDVLKSRHRMPKKNWVRILRLIYNPRTNFCFSTQTVSTVVVCTIFLYSLTVKFVHLGRGIIEDKSYNDILAPFNASGMVVGVANAFGGAFLASALLVTVVCAFSILRFMECHKNKMLQMFKGDTSFIPKGLKKSQLMVGRCLKYSGYHIAYFVWGYLLLFLFFLIVTSIVAFISYLHWERKVFMLILKNLGPFWLVTLIILVVLLASSMTTFRDSYFKKEVIALNNRNVYLVFSYFFFFLSLPMGFFSAILRVLKAMPVALFMLPRVDKCLMLDGFQSFDNGFAAYVCYLYVQAAHRNPILRVFCQIVHDEMVKPKQSTDGTLRTTKKYRNKWLLLVTLIRNPQLQRCRKHVIAPPVVRFVNDVQVSVEMTNFEKKMLH